MYKEKNNNTRRIEIMNKKKILSAFSAVMMMSSVAYTMELDEAHTPVKPTVQVKGTTFNSTPGTKADIELEQEELDRLTHSAIKTKARVPFENRPTMSRAQIERAAKLEEQKILREKAERESALYVKASAKHHEVELKSDAKKAAQSAKKRINKSEELLARLQTSFLEKNLEVEDLNTSLLQTKTELNIATEAKEQKAKELDELRASSGVDLEFISAQESEFEALSARYANLLERFTQAEMQLHTASSDRDKTQSRLAQVIKQQEDRLVSLTTSLNLADSDVNGDEEEGQKHSDEEENREQSDEGNESGDDSEVELGGGIDLDDDA